MHETLPIFVKHLNTFVLNTIGHDQLELQGPIICYWHFGTSQVGEIVKNRAHVVLRRAFLRKMKMIVEKLLNPSYLSFHLESRVGKI